MYYINKNNGEKNKNNRENKSNNKYFIYNINDKIFSKIFI